MTKRARHRARFAAVPAEASSMAADSMPTSGKWPKIFGQGLALIVLPSLVLVGLEIYQITRNVPELRRSQNLVDHTIEVITVTHALERAIRDAERGQRGFLITGDPAYLEPYRKGLQEIPG